MKDTSLNDARKDWNATPGITPAKEAALKSDDVQNLGIYCAIAGIIGFARTAHDAAAFRPFAKALADTTVKFEVNLWIEADLSLLGKTACRRR